MAFAKLDVAILNSTLWIDRDARDLFITALLMAMPRDYGEPIEQIEVRSLKGTGWKAPAGWYGFVPAAGVGIIHAAGCPLEEGLQGLERLGSPEPDSRSQEFGGRRMIRVDGGYLILNYMKYRERDHSAAERMRRLRARKKAKRDGVTTSRDSEQQNESVTSIRHVTHSREQSTENIPTDVPSLRSGEEQADLPTPSTASVQAMIDPLVEPPRAPDPDAAWSRDACDAWAERFKASAPPGGQIGRALKPLVRKHGWSAVRPAWRTYLAFSEPEYVSAARFAMTFGEWAQRAGRPLPL